MAVVKFESVTKKYGEYTALDNVSFQMLEGEILGFLGPNGAGKTTTIRLLLNLLEPSSGSVKVWDMDLKNTRDAIEVRKKIGFALDSPGHFIYSTARRNLMYYAKLYHIDNAGMRTEQLLKEFDLWDVKDKRVETFSKGMKQRLSLCRAFLNEPELLILDEPTSGLDPGAQSSLKKLISKKAGENKCTVLFSSHNLSEVEEICTNVALLDKGKLIFNDTLVKLKQKYSLPRVSIEIYPFNEKILENISNQKFVRAIKKVDSNVIVTLAEKENSHDLMRFLLNSDIQFQNFNEISPTLDEIYEKEVMRYE